jgi:hypothetical protein
MKSFQQIGTDIGELVQRKNAAYGSSFEDAGKIMAILYPDGITLGQLDHALLTVRILDKLKRVATDKDAFGESPFGDIAGYGILGVYMDLKKKESAQPCVSVSCPDAANSSKEPAAGAGQSAKVNSSKQSASESASSQRQRVRAHSTASSNDSAPAPAPDAKLPSPSSSAARSVSDPWPNPSQVAQWEQLNADGNCALCAEKLNSKVMYGVTRGQHSILVCKRCYERNQPGYKTPYQRAEEIARQRDTRDICSICHGSISRFPKIYSIFMFFYWAPLCQECFEGEKKA